MNDFAPRSSAGGWDYRILLPVVFLLVLAAAGCKSEPGAGVTTGVAAVTIKGRNRQQIIEAATTIFVRNGFRVAKPAGCDASFERQGSSWDKFAYSGLTGKAVWFRAKLFVRVRGAEERLLECELYRVEDMGDALMEEERPMTKLKGGPYRKLLEETRALLESPAS